MAITLINKDSRPVRRRSKTQGGSAILEGALVILPLMAIFFALLDFPLAIFIQNTLREAVREGVRFAITQQTGGGGQDAAIKAVVEQYAMGFLSDADITSGLSTFTIQYFKMDSTGNSTLASGVGSNAGGNICVVTAAVQRKWMAPLWRGTGLIPFYASSADVMESPPGGVIPTR